MSRVATPLLPIVVLAACDPVSPVNSSSTNLPLAPPSVQMSAAATGYAIVDLGGRFSRAVAINEAGQVVGTTLGDDGQYHGFLWADGVLTDIGRITPVSINQAGVVAGNCGAHACRWADGVITDLGTLGGAWSGVGQAGSEGIINQAGQVVGQSASADGRAHGFTWANGVLTDLVLLPSQLNASGQIAGTSSPYDPVTHASLWDKGATTDLGTLGGERSSATAINARGQVVGWSQVPDNTADHGFLWHNGTMADIGAFYPSLINAAGQVLGTASVEGGQHTVFWSNGVATDVGTLGGYRTLGSAVNDGGQVVGRSCVEPSEGPSCPWHAFLWSNGTITDLGTLGGPTSEARDINNAGYIVGVSQFSPESFETHAVLWRPMTGEAAMRRSSSSTRSR